MDRFGSEAGSVQIVKDPDLEVKNLTIPAADYHHSHGVEYQKKKKMHQLCGSSVPGLQRCFKNP
jgi:hypothetical protein